MGAARGVVLSGPFARLGIVGPTAAGKSTIGHRVAVELGDVEIVTVDSMQVYRGMDIGTAKPDTAMRGAVRYHLLDIVDPADAFGLKEFQSAAAEAITGIESRGHRPLLVGGTGLYVRAIVDELDLPGRFPRIRAELDAVDDLDELYERLVCIDPIAASRMERGNRRRIVRALEVCVGSGRPFSSYGPGMETYPPNDWDLVVVDMDAETAAARIDERFHRQLDEGFLEEVRDVRSRRGGLGPTASQALGYRQLAAYLEGSCSFGEAVDAAIAATRRFARRQRSWFARDPRLWHVTIGSAADIDLATRELVRRWS